MKVAYLYNSGFIINDESAHYAFDNITPFSKVSNIEILTNPNQTSHSDQPIFVFVSHGHSDHYTDSIFSWFGTNKNVYYIISKDVFLDEPTRKYIYSILPKNFNDNNLIIVEPHEKYTIGPISIKTFDSTDRGVSFMIHNNSTDHTIFHSGDLNWWHWKNDDLKTQLSEEHQYKNEIIKLKRYLQKQHIKRLDIAFIPLDTRLSNASTWAFEYFMKIIPSKYYIPMHFGEINPLVKNLSSQMGIQKDSIINISKDHTVILED